MPNYYNFFLLISFSDFMHLCTKYRSQRLLPKLNIINVFKAKRITYYLPGAVNNARSPKPLNDPAVLSSGRMKKRPCCK